MFGHGGEFPADRAYHRVRVRCIGIDGILCKIPTEYHNIPYYSGGAFPYIGRTGRLPVSLRLSLTL
ncbi:hypothetical protein EYF80_044822 [Liparis tanakae]|uniref:Uncharacterized protein n=1 Tax=Liparis tanakae TaxID=230148 RepID=A0A4Z2FUR3_9TELE|nr:hypothetical protein EYF80_044822 [Liparis tanakae]